MNFSRPEQGGHSQREESVNNSQIPFAPQNPYNFQGSLNFVTPQIVGDGWTSPMLPDWPPGEQQTDQYAITPLSTPISTPYGSSWNYFDENFKRAATPNEILSPTSVSFSDDATDYHSSTTRSGWNPLWTMQNDHQPPLDYLPSSVNQDRSPIQHPKVKVYEEGNTPQAYTYREASANTTVTVVEPSAKPKWGKSKGPRKKQEPKKSGEGSSRSKSSKKDHRRNSSHSSTTSSHHQLRSTKTAQKISYAEPSNSTAQPLMNSRASHNLVEKQYRNRLNDQFNTLLSSIPADVVGTEINGYGRGDGPERRVSKAEVLALAKRHIETLEKTKAGLEIEKEQLKVSVRRLKGAWANMGGDILP
ncbi:hypothetical protein BGZ60DRAFT_529413 [Tricladium varicosporioides]|nr:hypothetical protein BGZ60DRAFT_529413 [Hymenoscyphus varicosporioides]